MSSLVQRINSEWQPDRDWHSFKLRVNRTGDRNFISDHFNLVAHKSKVWCIEIACCKSSALDEKNIGAYFFACLPVKINFALFQVSALCSALCISYAES